MEYLPQQNVIDLTIYDSFISYLGELVSFPFSHVSCLFCIVVTWPLSYVYTFVNGRLPRHIFGLVIGIPLQYLMYREHVFIWWICQVVSYFFAFTLREYSKFPIVFTAIIANTYINIWRYYDHYLDYRIEVETVMMLGAMKVAAFGISLADGYMNKDEIKEYIDKISPNETTRKQNQKEFMEKRIEELPSFFEYMSYLNCFWSAVSGPNCDYMEHKNWIEQRGVYANIPSTLVPMLKWFIALLFFAFCYVVLYGQYLPLSFLMSEEFTSLPYYQKFFFTAVTGILLRTKFYMAWSFMQVNIVGCGIAYGKNDKGEDTWNTITWADPTGDIPFVDTCRTRVKKWNIACTKFFRLYIYNRLLSIFGIQMLCLFLVFVINALWHGFYPGYFFAMAIIMPLIEQTKCLYRLYQNKLKHIKWLLIPLAIIQWSWVSFVSSATFICLTILDYNKFKVFLDALYWVPCWFPLLNVIFFKITGFGQRSVSKQQRQGKVSKEK